MADRAFQRILAVVAVLLLLAARGLAQPAQVEGKLTDPSGAALPGVTVEVLRNGEVIRTVTTRSDGSFSFPIELRPDDTVEVRLSMAGFATEKIKLDPDRRRIQTSTEVFRLSLEVYPASTAARPPPSAPPPAAATPPPASAGPLPPEATPEENHAIVKVFYATDRRRGGGLLTYSSERNSSGNLSLGRFDVSVPRDHRLGNVERPNIW